MQKYIRYEEKQREGEQKIYQKQRNACLCIFIQTMLSDGILRLLLKYFTKRHSIVPRAEFYNTQMFSPWNFHYQIWLWKFTRGHSLYYRRTNIYSKYYFRFETSWTRGRASSVGSKVSHADQVTEIKYINPPSPIGKF